MTTVSLIKGFSHIATDIDECSMNLCEHNCMNTIGSFECSCRDGFDQDGLNCTGTHI